MGTTDVPTTTIIIASVASTGAVLLLLGSVFVFVILRRRKQHVQVPTDDPELVTKRTQQDLTREAGSIDSNSQRPLLYDDTTRSPASPRPAQDSSASRQSSGLHYTKLHESSADTYPSIQTNFRSTPSFDTSGKDRITHLATGHTMLSQTPPRSQEEHEESVDSHAAPSTIELPNPFAESVAPSTASPGPSDLSRSESSLATNQAATCVPLVQSPTQLTISLPLPDSGDAVEQLELVSPAEILPVPSPAKLHAVALLSSASNSSLTAVAPIRSLPPPPSPAPRSNSVVIRPLPRTPTLKAQLTRSKSAKSQSADMRIAVLSNSTGGVKRRLDSTSDDSASVYSQASARSEWVALVNPHDSIADDSPTLDTSSKMIVDTTEFAELVNPHDRDLASAHQNARRSVRPLRRSLPARTRTTDSPAASSSSSSGSSFTVSWDRLGSLSSVPEDADPGSAAVSMRFALAQAVEAARRDSLYHAQLESPQKVTTKDPGRPVSGVSVISDDVERFEQDMKTWLTSPRVSTPTEYLR